MTEEAEKFNEQLEEFKKRERKTMVKIDAKTVLPIIACFENHLYRHKKTGGIYKVICGALDEADPSRALVIYKSEADGTVWAREANEFCDGRFESANPPQSNGDKTDD